MKKRLLFVISALETGGAEKSLVNLLNQMDYEKYDVDLLLFKRQGVFLKQVPDKVNIIEAPYDLYCLFNPPKKRKDYFLAFKQSLIRFIGSIYKRIFYSDKFFLGMQARWDLFYKKSIGMLPGMYDVAVSYMDGESMYYVAEKTSAKRKITWVHNDYRSMQLSPQKDYPYFCAFDQVITISDECVKIWQDCFPNLKNRIQCIPNITSTEFARRMAGAFYPEEYKDTKNAKILLSIGRLSQQKGFDIAVDAAQILKAKGLKFKWFVIGQGELKEALQEQIKKNEVEDCFVLLGVRENPYPYIANADVLVQSSRFEGKSVVLDEAKILSKPLVVTNYPTVHDQIIDGREGIITEIKPDAISSGIISILEDNALYSDIERYLKEHEYGNVDQMEKYEKIFDA